MSLSKDLTSHRILSQSSSDKDIDLDGEAYIEFENFDFEHNQNFQTGWSALSDIVNPSKLEDEYLKAKVFFFSKYYRPISLDRYHLWKKTLSSENNGVPCRGQTEQDITDAGRESLSEKLEQREHNLIIDSKDVSDDCQNNDVKNCNTASGNAKKHSVNKGANISSSNSCNCDSLSKQLHSTSLDSDMNYGCHTDAGSSVTNDKNECVEKSEEEKSKFPSNEDGISSLSLLEVASYIQNGLPIPGLVSMEVHPTNQAPTPSCHDRKLKPWEIKVTKTAESS